MQVPRANRSQPTDSSAQRLSALAFADRFRDSFRVLWLVALSVLHDAASAEDAVQEAAVIALQKLDQFDPGTSFSAWVGQIVRNVALNRARKERRSRSLAVDPATIDGWTGGRQLVRGESGSPDVGEFPINEAEIDHRITRALSEVSDMARACLLLRTLEGMEYSQIAGLLGIPEGTAMSHVHRTRRYLRDRLADIQPGFGRGDTIES